MPVSKKCVNLVRDIPTELPHVGNVSKKHTKKIKDFKKMIPYLEDEYQQIYVDLCRNFVIFLEFS